MLFEDAGLSEHTSCGTTYSEQSDAGPKRPIVVSPTDGGAPLITRQIEAEISFLRRMVRRWHRNAADADDLVQDTLLRALSSAHLWQPGSSLRAWLLTIMRNQFLATVERSRRAQQAAEVIEYSAAGGAAAAAGPEAQLILRDVERAVRRLSINQQAVVMLTAVEGKSYGEVAASMGLSVEGVRCHLARARCRLRAAVYAPPQPS